MRNLNADHGLSLGGALALARQDERLIQRYFTTPAGLAAGAAFASGQVRRQSVSAPASSSNVAANPGGKQGRGKGNVKKSRQKRKAEPKAAGKKGGKGSGTTSTPDGRQKCFKYNKGTCTSGACPDGRIHVCLKCDGPHPAKECPQR